MGGDASKQAAPDAASKECPSPKAEPAPPSAPAQPEAAKAAPASPAAKPKPAVEATKAAPPPEPEKAATTPAKEPATCSSSLQAAPKDAASEEGRTLPEVIGDDQQIAEVQQHAKPKVGRTSGGGRNSAAAATSAGGEQRTQRERRSRGDAGNPDVDGRKLCVKNLPESATNAWLKDVFAPAFAVSAVDVKMRDDGKCRGFGFVTLPTTEDAQKAIEKLNGTKAGDRDITVLMANPQKGKGASGDGKGFGKEGKGKGKGGKGKDVVGGAYVVGGQSWQLKDGHGKGGAPAGGGAAPAAGAVQAASPAMAAYYSQAYMQAMGNYQQQYAAHAYHAYYQQQQYAAAAVAAAAASPAAVAAAYGTPAAAYATPHTGYAAPQAVGFGALSAPVEGIPAGETGTEEVDHTEYEGSLKSISEKNGYGFIACEQTYIKYGRDVYVAKGVLPENAKALDRLKFYVVRSDKGHPKADRVRVIPIGFAPPQQPASR